MHLISCNDYDSMWVIVESNKCKMHIAHDLCAQDQCVTTLETVNV